MNQFIRRATILCISLFIANTISATSLSGDPATITFNLNSCNAWIPSNDNNNFSEFTGAINNTNEISMSVVGGHLYRQNPDDNGHSCTAGLNGTNAMCISADDECLFNPNSEKSVNFDIQISPIANKFVQLSSLNFHEMAPEFFSWNDGFTSLNDYPTRYAVRVMKNGAVIYEATDIQTTQEWSLENYNFSGEAFKVGEPTVFNFELIAYCPIGANAVQHVWDLEDIEITTLCLDQNIANGGEITGGPFTYCLDGDEFFLPSIGLFFNYGQNNAWVVTDAAGMITALPTNIQDVNFAAIGGTSYIQHIAYQNGLTGLTVGSNISNLGGTTSFSLSNSITVTATLPAGGTVAGGPYSFCVDGNPDFVSGISVNGSAGTNMQWVITDAAGVIMGLPANVEEVNFDDAGVGSCFIWNVSYESITNLAIGNNIEDLGGCVDVSNGLLVERIIVNGGSLSGGPFEFCVDEEEDFISNIELTGVDATLTTTWIITDVQLNILGVPADPTTVDFNAAGAGVCFLWAITSSGTLEEVTIDNSISDIEGCYAISNSIQISRISPNGGTLEGGPFEFCVDGEADFVSNVSIVGASAGDNQWIVTDEDGTILGLPDNIEDVNFDDAGVGVCLIWNLASSGEVTGLEVDNEVSDLNGCFGLSDSISVVRTILSGGTLEGGPFNFCIDGVQDTVSNITLTGNTEGNTSWVVTDEDGVILGLPDNIEGVDFDEAGAGTCFIYSLSYQNGLSGLEVGTNIDTLSGCLGFSNSIAVNRTNPEGGVVAGGPFEFCLDDTPDMVTGVTVTGNSGVNSSWVITDTLGIIIGIADTIANVDFNDAEPGICLIWNISYGDDTDGLEVGEDVEDISGCFEISENNVVVTRSGADGGTLEGGPYDVCLDDESDFVTDLNLAGNEGDNSIFLVTNEEGDILDITTQVDTIDFNSAPVGVCFIWNISYVDGLEDLETGNNVSDLVGCYDLSNSVSVTRTNTDGGVLTSDNFAFMVDGTPDMVSGIVVSDTIGSTFGWIVTDADLNILGLPADIETVDFDEAGAGICLIWYISHSALTGLEVGNTLNDLDGCFDLSNSITVTRIQTAALVLTGGPFDFCVDGTPDMVSGLEVTGANGTNANYIITNAQDSIIGLPMDIEMVDFDEAGAGVCYIYYLSSEDDLMGLATGNFLSDLTGTFDLSNSVVVTRTEVDGGLLTSDDFNFMVDGTPDMVSGIVVSDTIGANFSWVVTDADLNILAVTSEVDTINFDDAGAGVCLIWYVAYDDISGLAVGSSANDLTGCFDLSNSITVNRVIPGVLTLTGGPFSFCVDGVADMVTGLEVTNATGTNANYIITNAQDSIIGLPMDIEMVDFDEAGAGVCYIYYLSSEDDLMGLMTGNFLSDLTGTFTLSNNIVVTRTEVDGGLLTSDDFNFTVDGTPDMVSGIVVSDTIGANFSWVVTDADLNILAVTSEVDTINFDEAGAGVCLIWYVAYDDISGLEVGSSANDLSGCFDLSNSVTVNRVAPAVLTLAGGPFSFCVDGVADMVTGLEVSNATGTNANYIITNAQDSIIGLPMDIEMVDFDEAGAGVCYIYYLSSEDDLMGLMTGNFLSDLTGTFTLSNSVVVTRIEVDGGVLTSEGFNFTVDGTPDMVSGIVVSDTIGANFSWVVTDADLNILAVTSEVDTIDFDAAGAGVCLIWYVAYDDISGLEVGSSANDLSGCFDLSNSITVNRTAPAVLTLTGGPFNFCVDGVADMVTGLEVSNATGTNGNYIIANAQDSIIGLPMDIEMVDFDEAGVGVCYIYYLSSEDDLMGLMTGNFLSDLTGTFDLSNNVVVNRTIPSGGTITGGPYSFCLDESDDFITDLELTGNVGSNTQWIVTDADENIITVTDSIENVNFNDADVGTCLIWSITYEDGLNGLINQSPLSILNGCFALSNSVEVVRSNIEGGTLEGGPFSFCVDMEMDTVSNITLAGATGLLNSWVITDEEGNILGTPDDIEDVDFNASGVGVCFIWNLSYQEGLTGLAMDNNVDDLEGCFELSNSITVTRSQPSGGMIEGGPFTFTIDGIEDNVSGITLTGNDADNEQWMVTSPMDTILALADDIETINFDMFGVGECQISHIGFGSGTLGLTEGNAIEDIVGCYDISNTILVTKTPSIGGVLSGGPFDFCIDEDSDFVSDVEITDNGGSINGWIVAEEDGTILALPNNIEIVDFNASGVGVCYIYHISYEPMLTGLDVDANISGLMGTFGLSNAVIVNRSTPAAGTLTGGPFEFCLNGVEDMVTGVELVGNVGSNTSWIITDLAGVIVGVPDTLENVNFDDAGPGTCLIYSISYNDGVEGIAIDSLLSNIEGCFEISNSITVERTQIDGGLLTGGPFNFCLDDTPDNVTGISLSDFIGPNISWVVTNDAGVITNLVESLGDIDFNETGPGTNFIYNIAFETGLTGLTEGANIANLEGCFDFSDPIVVNKTSPSGGTISGETFSFCIDAVDDFVTGFTVTDTIGSNFSWLITDISGDIVSVPDDILTVNFNNLGGDELLVWHIAFEDGLTGLFVGENVSDLEGCFDISVNNIIVNTIEPLGGNISPINYTFCKDGVPDFVTGLTLTDTVGVNFDWVITDLAGVIASIPVDIDTFDFDNSALGTCLIYNLTYEAGLTGLTVGENIDDLDGCFDFSNSTQVIKEDCVLMTNDSIVINEIFPDDSKVELKNVGSTTIDVSQFALCQFPNYGKLTNLPLDCSLTDYIMEPGDILVVEFNAVLSSSTGEIGLYNNDVIGFGYDDSANIVDYVEWGESNHERSEVAVEAGIWTAGDFVPAFSNDNSIRYDGIGNSPFDWLEASSTLCTENTFNNPEPIVQKVTLFPNPVNSQINIDFAKSMEETVTVKVYNSFGKLISQEQVSVSGGESPRLDISQLKEGAYILEVSMNGFVEAKRFIKI